MAISDLESFLRERVTMWDPNVDTAAGSPFDLRVVQPLLSRVGKDPFGTNLSLFIRERLSQEFPNMNGEVLSDLLIKASEVLLDPIVRETNRIALAQSVKDPAMLTNAEAEALGANLFSPMRKGNKARVTVRVWFTAPRAVTVNPSDYITTNIGLIFLPSSVQSIKADEMLLNRDGSEYYFDIKAIAEQAGDQYNVEAGSVVSVSNVNGYTRVTNLLKADSGTPADDSESYISRIPTELSEKSLNTMRGTVSLLLNNFPEITRVATVGMSDPEMQRDVIKGGGLGEIVQVGSKASGFPDGESRLVTRRIRVEDDGVDFTGNIGPVGMTTNGFGITLVNAFSTSGAKIQDVRITKVIDSRTLELADQVILSGSSNIVWALRRINITLSGIPGGIVFPDGPNGSTEVKDSEVHIGGCTDIYVQGSSFEENTLIIDNASDDMPLLRGTKAYASQVITSLTPRRYLVLADYTYYDGNNTATCNYRLQESDTTYQMLQKAATEGNTLKIMYPPSMAGTYRVVAVIQDITNAIIDSNRHPVLVVDKDLSAFYPVTATWKVQDTLDIELVEPKETRWNAQDGRSYIGLSYMDTKSGTDFDAVGVSAGDILRLHNGSDKGDYTVTSIGGPGNQRVYVSTPIKHSGSDLSFTIFRANQAGGVVLPMLRTRSVKILDSSMQPTGTTVPYGPAVYAKSLGFANNAHGARLVLEDACLGIVGRPLDLDGDGDPVAAVDIIGSAINISWQVQWVPGIDPYRDSVTVNFTSNKLKDVVAAINSALSAVGVAGSAAYIVSGNRLGIAPIGPNTEVTGFSYTGAWAGLFGVTANRWAQPITSKDVRSDYVSAQSTPTEAGWDAVDIDRIRDGIDIVTGGQVGYHSTYTFAEQYGYYHYQETTSARLCADTDFYPESDICINIGYRSIGVARTYFLDPVTVSFGPTCTFRGITADGTVVTYSPDPTNSTTKIPAYPSTAERKDGQFLPSTKPTFYSASTNFIEEVQVGDELVIEREWVTGTVDLPDIIDNLASKILVLSIGKSADITIQFTATGTQVSQAELVKQINQAVGFALASIVTDTLGKHIAFKCDDTLIVKHRTGAEYANVILGLAVTTDVSNISYYRGTFYIERILDEHTVQLRQSDFTKQWFAFSTGSCLHFSVVTPKTQRISATAMSKNVTPEGLYYCDVQLVSNGVGDQWNLMPDVELVPTGYRHFGYELAAKDINMTYSMKDQPVLRLSPIMFPVGATDNFTNSLKVTNQNVQVTYETSALVGAVQDFCLSELERVTNMSPLVRHLVPYFVRLAVTYFGGAKESVIKAALEKYIKRLFPDDSLTVDMVMDIIKARGASDIVAPISLYALVYNLDRSIWAEVSQDRVNTGRLAAFVPDALNLSRKS